MGTLIARPFKGHHGKITSVASSPDGTRIVSGSFDRTVMVWNAKTGEEVTGPFKGHNDTVFSVAFSLDGRQIVSGSLDRRVPVLDAESGEIVAELSREHTEGVISVAFSPDGTRVASGSAGHTIRVWDVITGETVREAFKAQSGVTSIAFSPDGIGSFLAPRTRQSGCGILVLVRWMQMQVNGTLAGSILSYSRLTEDVSPLLPMTPRFGSGTLKQGRRPRNTSTGTIICMSHFLQMARSLLSAPMT